MNIFHAFILGIVEGLTEFLPISSTAHLIVASRILHIPQTDFQKFFEVFIQFGAILAVAVLFAKELLTHRKLIYSLILSFLPTAVIGFVLYKIIKNVFFEAYGLMVFVFIVFGIVFIVQELWLKKTGREKQHRSVDMMTATQAVIVGLAQSLAVIPGVSRSGIVIVCLLFLGFRRDESAKYSFLLALPTIAAASLYDLYKSRNVLMGAGGNISALVVGFVMSFIVAYMAIRWFIKYLQKHSLAEFGVYRIVGGLIWAVFLITGMF